MAEWLYEAGIGEARAALIDRDRLLEMAIEAEDDPSPRAGAILPARLVRGADASGRGMVELEGGTPARLIPVPPGLTEGAALLVEVTREPMREGAMLKPAHVRRAAHDAMSHAAPDLLARISASGVPVRRLATGTDTLDRHGWSDALEEAQSGLVTTPDIQLRIALTPAMTLIDVDGSGAAADVAIAGARVAGETIRRFGITGSIGIDLPTLAGKAERQAAAAALDGVLPAPFERTAVNGFGFLQLVRRRERPSLPERLAADPTGAAARAMLARAERSDGHGALTLVAHPHVVTRLADRPQWLALLARRMGAPVALREDARLAISSGHASRDQP